MNKNTSYVFWHYKWNNYECDFFSAVIYTIFSAQVLGIQRKECSIYGKNSFWFLCFKLIQKFILLKAIGKYHPFIFMHHRGKNIFQFIPCLNSKLMHKETFNLCKGSSDMEQIEWNNCLWKSNYNYLILRNEPCTLRVSVLLFIPELTQWNNFSKIPHCGVKYVKIACINIPWQNKN